MIDLLPLLIVVGCPLVLLWLYIEFLMTGKKVAPPELSNADVDGLCEPCAESRCIFCWFIRYGFNWSYLEMDHRTNTLEDLLALLESPVNNTLEIRTLIAIRCLYDARCHLLKDRTRSVMSASYRLLWSIQDEVMREYMAAISPERLPT